MIIQKSLLEDKLVLFHFNIIIMFYYYNLNKTLLRIWTAVGSLVHSKISGFCSQQTVQFRS